MNCLGEVMRTEGRRAVRVAERFREELAWLLLQELRDPRMAGLIITGAVVQPDLKSVKVYVRRMDQNASEENRDATHKEMLSALKGASGLLRRELGQRLRLRYAPELHFFYDDGVEKQMRIERLLAEDL